MALDTRIISAGKEADVTEDGELLVNVSPNPAFVPQRIRPFRQYLTTDGTATGSNDMGIDGSSTAVEFFVTATNDADRYINHISFIVGYGTTGQPFQWADGTALTNGHRVFYESATGQVDIHEGITNNQDMFRLAHMAPTASWEVRGVGANNDYGYFVTIDLESFVPPFGIQLGKSTTDRFCVVIRDNAGTSADIFNAIAYGFDRFE